MIHKGFLLPEVCRVLDCKVHHIRYIEEQLPIISTSYDNRGRKMYSLKDIFLFSRILSQTKGQGKNLEQAVDSMFSDLSASSLDTTARFLQLRHELLRTRLHSVQTINRLSLKYDSSTDATAKHSSIFADSTNDQKQGVHPLAWFSPEEMFPSDVYEDLETELRQYLEGERLSSRASTIAPLEKFQKPGREQANAASILNQGRWVVLSPDAYRQSAGSEYSSGLNITPVRRLSVLEYMAEKVHAAANESGQFPLWIITVRKTHFYQLLGLLNRHNFFAIPRNKILVLPQPDFQGRSTGDGGALFAVKQLAEEYLASLSMKFIVVLSPENPLIPIPDEKLVETLFKGDAPLLHASVRRSQRGELYIRLPLALDTQGINLSIGNVNVVSPGADNIDGQTIVPAFPAMKLERVSRPYSWEFLPPFYYKDGYDPQLLTRHMVLTFNSWSGYTGSESEISPLFARDRDEFRRRMGLSGRRFRRGLYI